MESLCKNEHISYVVVVVVDRKDKSVMDGSRFQNCDGSPKKTVFLKTKNYELAPTS